ncbi:MAG: SAM-dependent methyltransferase [Planctomycetota bacterium]
MDLVERIRGFVRLADAYEAAELRRALEKARRELGPEHEAAADLNERDARVLAELALGGPLGFAELVARLDERTSETVHKSTISQSVARLAETKGLVTRTYERGPRQPVLHLTDLGARVGREIALVFQAVPANVGECFGGDLERLREMAAGFDRFSSVLTDKAENIRPSSARIYDYLIGGWHHTVADREGARQLLGVLPDARGAALANRAFLRRAVRYLCAERGVRQFIDIGAGLPTTGSTHQIAQALDPSSRVVYVDRDREAVELARLATDGNDNVRCAEGDFLQIGALAEAGALEGLIDPDEPTAVVCVALLHDVPDDEMAALAMRRIRERHIGDIGYLVLSHGAGEGEPDETELRAKEVYENLVRAPTKGRTAPEITELFLADLPLVDPGLVWAPEWRPEIEDPYLPPTGIPFTDRPARSMMLCGVASASG